MNILRRLAASPDAFPPKSFDHWRDSAVDRAFALIGDTVPRAAIEHAYDDFKSRKGWAR